MSPASQHDRAAAFRRLHPPAAARPLVLPNAWDAWSARLVEAAGAPAVATTSAGVSWTLGARDGGGLTRAAMVDAVRRIAAAVRVPVTADVEGGYGRGTPDDVAETVRRVLDAGAVGINLEDAGPASGSAGTGDAAVLLAPEAQAARVRAAREAAAAAGADLFVNARVDVYLRGVGAESDRFDETVRRARAYVEAGADGVFVPGVVDAATVGRLAAAAAALGAPLNVMAGPGAPTVGALAALGVGRVSVGPGLALAAMGHARWAAAELLDRGTYTALEGGLAFAEADALFAPGA